MTQKRFEILGKMSAKKPEIQDIISLLLANRGFKTSAEISDFLSPSLDMLTAKQVKIKATEMKKALARIDQAIAENEEVVIFGDYDVDGITATAILWETLYKKTKHVIPYIPDRIEEGYGLSVKGISHVVSEHPNTSLIITVDNGIVAHGGVDFAKEKGIDVIVTDHHVAGETLPQAFAIVHTTELCGAGIAYLVAREISGKQENDDHLELAALGTIADLVPLTNANRAIVKFGIEKLKETSRLGLKALYQAARIEPTAIDTYGVGHMIAPRLNATGRLASAMDSLRLLCTHDTTRANELAEYLEKTNRERQLLMREATEHAVVLAQKTIAINKLIIVAHESYQQGVIGLVAGRLVEEYYRPSIVISLGEKESKASARSISGFNIIETLRKSSNLLIDVGGHPMAAGFTIETRRIEEFKLALEVLSQPLLTDEVLERKLRIDCELPLTLVDNKFYDAVQTLSPFGMGNPEPVFLTKNVEVLDIRAIGRDGAHLKMTLRQGKKSFDAIGFGMGELASEISSGDKISAVYTVDKNTWNGNTKLQLKIKEIKLS